MWSLVPLLPSTMLQHHLTAVVLLFLFQVQCQSLIGCWEDGKCEDSELITIEVDVSNPEECLEFCNSTDDCLYFSYDPSIRLCFEYATCVNLSTETCPGCTSGDFNCTSIPCFENGTCTGTDIGYTAETSQEGCLDECRGNLECQFFSYDKGTTLCILYGDAECDFDATCLSCVYGSKDCHLEDGGLSKILIVGGFNGAGLADAELIDMVSSLTCDDPTDFPVATWGYTSALVNNVAWFCGGMYTNGCRTYNSTSNSWQTEIPMLSKRHLAASALIRGGTEWWIVGGWSSSSAVYLDSTEVLRNGEFFPGTDLPENMTWPCLVSINTTHVFLAGGSLGATGAPSAKAYILELDSGHDWQSIPDMATARWKHTCNLVNTAEFGREIVVVGGAGTNTEIYSLDDNTWRVGPPFPHSITQASSVDYQNSFLVIGGLANSVYSDEIYQLNLENWTWEKKPQTLTKARMEFAAVMLPDDQVNCH